MDKLKSSFTKYQTQVFATNPRFVSSEKANNLSKLADSQLQKMRARNDFTHYEEAVFYKQKFGKLSEVASKFESNQITEANYHQSVRGVMQNDFRTSLSNPPRQSATILPNPVISVTKSRSKSPLNEFFEQEEAKKSKGANFSRLLSQEQTPLKYKLRSVSRSKSPVPVPKNDEELRRLEEQNRRLRQKINNEKSLTANEQERLRELRERLRQLDEQNRRLKTEVSKSQRSDIIVEQEYDPYNLKVRQNDIVKIHNKNLSISQKMSQYGGFSEDLNIEKRSQKVYYEKQSDHIRQDLSQLRYSPFKKSNNEIDPQDILNASQSTIQTHFLNLEESELYDDERNQLCRQKIAFFKKSMVLAKNPEFDIAFKRSDFNFQMDKLRMILYVNNKSSFRYNCTIDYDYDRQDFDINIKKSLAHVEPRSQAREQIEITLKNPSDLGSIIHAKVLVGDKMKKIIVPALFIDFDSDYKYQFQNIGYLQRNLAQPLTIRPMSQFLTIDKASGVLDLTRDYEQKYEVGKLYGKSKACKGMVKLTWRKDKLKIQTCEEWRTLMGYLFLNAEETLNY